MSYKSSRYDRSSDRGSRKYDDVDNRPRKTDRNEKEQRPRRDKKYDDDYEADKVTDRNRKSDRKERHTSRERAEEARRDRKRRAASRDHSPVEEKPRKVAMSPPRDEEARKSAHKYDDLEEISDENESLASDSGVSGRKKSKKPDKESAAAKRSSKQQPKESKSSDRHSKDEYSLAEKQKYRKEKAKDLRSLLEKNKGTGTNSKEDGPSPSGKWIAIDCTSSAEKSKPTESETNQDQDRAPPDTNTDEPDQIAPKADAAPLKQEEPKQEPPLDAPREERPNSPPERAISPDELQRDKEDILSGSDDLLPPSSPEAPPVRSPSAEKRRRSRRRSRDDSPRRPKRRRGDSEGEHHSRDREKSTPDRSSKRNDRYERSRHTDRRDEKRDVSGETPRRSVDRRRGREEPSNRSGSTHAPARNRRDAHESCERGSRRESRSSVTPPPARDSPRKAAATGGGGTPRRERSRDSDIELLDERESPPRDNYVPRSAWPTSRVASHPEMAMKSPIKQLRPPLSQRFSAAAVFTRIGLSSKYVTAATVQRIKASLHQQALPSDAVGWSPALVGLLKCKLEGEGLPNTDGIPTAMGARGDMQLRRKLTLPDEATHSTTLVANPRGSNFRSLAKLFTVKFPELRC